MYDVYCVQCEGSLNKINEDKIRDLLIKISVF
jgi:hypothetical protein